MDDLKCAVVGIPYGGARAASSSTPKPSQKELEGLTRRFFTEIDPVGPERTSRRRTSTPTPRSAA
jgi:glutamate dehydrogenase/leucine dehydrogenase